MLRYIKIISVLVFRTTPLMTKRKPAIIRNYYWSLWHSKWRYFKVCDLFLLVLQVQAPLMFLCRVGKTEDFQEKRRPSSASRHLLKCLPNMCVILRIFFYELWRQSLSWFIQTQKHYNTTSQHMITKHQVEHMYLFTLLQSCYYFFGNVEMRTNILLPNVETRTCR